MNSKQEMFALAAFATVMCNVTDGWIQTTWAVLALVFWALVGVVSYLERVERKRKAKRIEQVVEIFDEWHPTEAQVRRASELMKRRAGY